MQDCFFFSLLLFSSIISFYNYSCLFVIISCILLFILYLKESYKHAEIEIRRRSEEEEEIMAMTDIGIGVCCIFTSVVSFLVLIGGLSKTY